MIDQKEEIINCLTALCKSNRISVGETIALEKVIKELQEMPEYIDIWNVGAILRNVPEQPDICKIYGGVCGYPIEACSECLKHEGWRPSKEQTRWIPCSERLPEESGDYLVTTKWKGSYSGEVYIETNMDVYREKSKEWSCVDVIAWMPLPQPYAESGEEG